MQRNGKVKNVHELGLHLAEVREKDRNKTVVQCHGVFDLLHIGHIRHLEQAKKFGDLLVVTVTPDRFVNKGTHRPAFTEDLRLEAIAALDCVDYVALNQWPSALETLHIIKPNFYAKGSDYRDAAQDITGKILEEVEAVESLGGRIIYTDDIAFSSSHLINKHLEILPSEVSDFLSSLSEKYSINDVMGYIENAKTLNALVIGEAIIDEYCYCEVVGKASKEPVLAAHFKSLDKFAGGVLAIANHAVNFYGRTGVVTMVGEESSQEEFVRSNTNAPMDYILRKANSPTIVKRRFVESYLLQKLFEVYEMNDEALSPKQDQELCDSLEEIIPQYDIVIVADYGHGMLTPNAVDVLCGKSKFLTVNTQANAGNRGFNTISKYPRADYICLASPEIALEERAYGGNQRDMILSVSEKLECSNIVVTQGRSGSLCYNAKEGFVEVPAFAGSVVDRVGAGDAVLSLTSLCVAQGAPMDIVGFIGNVAGAQAVATLGHTHSIERIPFLKHIESLLK